MNQHQAPANAMHLQQEVKSFFQNHSPADLEQDLYDLLQENLETQPDVQLAKSRLHTYRELTHFVYRISKLV